MVKQIIGETFEQLGQTAGQVVKQAAQEPGKIAETAAGQIGRPGPEPGIEPPQGQRLSSAQKAQKKVEEKRQLTYLQAELGALAQKKAQELPKQVTGKPGFSEEKAIKQLETQKEKKEIEPLVVAQARLKGGTGERRKMGPSG